MLTEPRLKLTYEDYLHFPDDGRRHEIIDGEHCVTPSPVPRHQYVIVQLIQSLAPHTRPGMGTLLTAPVDVILSESDVVQPDVVFVRGERRGILGDRGITAAPDLVVEVLSPATRRRDEITKRHLYELHGVAEYWVVDPEIEVVKVYRRGGPGGFVRAAGLSTEAADRLETPQFPGWSLPLADLFTAP